MSWILAVLVAIDQLGNAIAGGNPDATISARVGYWAQFAGQAHKWYWLILEKIIDFTFYPLDGPKHCYQNYLEEQDEAFQHGNDLAIAVLGLIIITVCIPLSIILRIAVLFIPAWRFKGNPTPST
jgi:hypothetical protein